MTKMLIGGIQDVLEASWPHVKWMLVDSPKGWICLSVVAALLSLGIREVFLWVFRPKLKIKNIVLSDRISSARARALEYCYRPREVMLTGYKLYPDTVYGMNTRDGVKVVIPPAFLDSLKSHPTLSFKTSIDNDMQAEFTYFGGPPEHVIHAIKGGMTSALSAYTPVLHKMVQSNMPKMVGVYNDWTRVKVHDRVLRLTGTNNARVFQSTAASLDEEWVAASTAYVITTFDCIRALKEWPPFLRPFVYRLIPQRSAIKDQWRIGRKRVTQTVLERLQKGSNLEDPPSMLDLLSSDKNAQYAGDVDKQLLYQMTLVAVGTVTTFSSIIQAIYDLVAHPEYIPELREEVETVLRDDDGAFNRESISAMKKLDSFIKESQRLSAPDLSTFQRGATQDMTLPDGTYIPKGTKLEVNTASIHLDPVHYENPHQFDGLRYYRMRQRPGEENKHLYYSVGKNDLSFGYGRHACPGRYLGHLNIKLVLAELLTRYDLNMLPGRSRARNFDFEALSAPDENYEILMKSRKT